MELVLYKVFMLSIFELIKFRRAYTRRKLTNKDLKSKLKVRQPKAIAVNDSIAKELFGGGYFFKMVQIL